MKGEHNASVNIVRRPLETPPPAASRAGPAPDQRRRAEAERRAMVAVPAKHPLHPTSNCYKRAIVRACCDKLREIEGRLEQSVGPRFEQQLQSCDDLCGVARLILMLQRRTELRDFDSGWLEARSGRPQIENTARKPNLNPERCFPLSLSPTGARPSRVPTFCTSPSRPLSPRLFRCPTTPALPSSRRSHSFRRPSLTSNAARWRAARPLPPPPLLLLPCTAIAPWPPPPLAPPPPP